MTSSDTPGPTHLTLCIVAKAYRDTLPSQETDSSAWVIYESSAERGLELINEIGPDLVLLGVHDEGLEGVEFLARVKKECPDFDRDVIVFPEATDSFPPITYSKDRTSGIYRGTYTQARAVKQRISNPPVSGQRSTLISGEWSAELKAKVKDQD